MHGCGSGSALLVNAEVDSMGGVVDVGVGIGAKASPRRAAIEKAQAELRQEYDAREERRRELEFLEKGGNPLDFKFGNVASASVQSTSLTDHHAEHFITSEARGSFPSTASPHGDSVESSGRPGAPTVCEPNSADNFDGENGLLEDERKSKHRSKRSNIAPLEQSSQMDGNQNAKESEDSAIVRPYARRNRSKPNRDCARSSSTDVLQSSGGHGSSLPVPGGLRDTKGLLFETNNQKGQIIPLVSNTKSTNSNGDIVSQIETSNTNSNMELDSVQALETTTTVPEDRLDVTEHNMLRDNQNDQPSEVDIQKAPSGMAPGEGEDVGGKDHPVESAGPECPPCATTAKTENVTGFALPNGFGDLKRSSNEGQNGSAAIGTKGLDSESSWTQNSLSLDVNNDSDLCINRRSDDTNGIRMKQTSEFEGTQNSVAAELEKEKNETKAIDGNAIMKDGHGSVYGGGYQVKTEDDVQRNSDLQIEVKYPSNIEGVEQIEHAGSEIDKKVSNLLGDDSNREKENISPGGPRESMEFSTQEVTDSTSLEKNSSAAPDPQSCSNGHLKLANKAHEDSILEEARTIEAKRKRITELSFGTLPSEINQKSQWDFVLEEMAWLANDFAQERLWKLTAAAQICHRVAFTRVKEQNQHLKLRKVAYTLAKAVMQFWHSVELLLDSKDQRIDMINSKHDLRMFEGTEASKDKFGELDKEACKELDQHHPIRNVKHAVHGYAVRFLKCNSSPVPSLQAEAPATPERMLDSGIMDIAWDDHLTEESLFYAVPSGAMETYRKSIESHLVQSEKTRRSMQEEVDTSVYDPATEFGYRENADDEEGETSTYYLHGAFEGRQSTKHEQKKRKNLMKSYSVKQYELGADMPYGHSTVGSQQNMLMGKRPASNLNVGSIPTKRLRTASRQRVISPYSAGTTEVLQAPIKTDASSGDTSSFQDDQSTLHGGSQIQKSVEVESVGDFEKQLPYDCAETSMKPKKKKKAKFLGSAYEQGWQLDSMIQNEQRENYKKRLESHHFDSNGTSGLYGQHPAKKPKMMKQSVDNTFDMVPMTGSIPSPAASQMSNMPNTNRLMKLIGGRDRGRKTKSLKLSAGQPGSGTPWSPLEEQALVVLVHDLGPNWDLVSDTINSILKFKCIFRKSKECKEHHKILVDVDSAEDSGSSQSYPSTLPGIPKGSAMQLFHCLQGPMLEDTIKSHFEKIIMIGKKQHSLRSQNDNQDPKQIAAVHNSHFFALSKVCPNNLNGDVLMPLDLCDATTSSPDIPVAYQGSHGSGLVMPNQGAVASILPTSGANSSLQGSPNVVLSNNSSSPSGPPGAPVRDGRYTVPRTSLPVDEQQRIQHYNQILSSRNLQQSNLSVSGTLSGADRNVGILPGGTGMCVVPGMNRGLPLSRPGFQGMASSSMPNSGSMLSSSMVGMPSPVNMHPGTGSGQGNSMMRAREALHMIRPGHNPERQRQMMVPELQMQVTQGNSQGIPALNGLSSAFANQTTPPSVQTYPGHPQQQHQMSPQQSHMVSNPHHPHLQSPNHTTGPQQQTYAIRLAKERQMQHRLLQQQQQQFAASTTLMPQVQHQPQLAMSSSMQNSSQIQPQTSSQPVSLPSLTQSSPMTPVSGQGQQQQQPPLKHNLPHHGLSRNPQTGASGLSNQMGKQRPRQPQQQQQFQQPGRNHPQQRQLSQQAKLLKGMGRGNMAVHQNLPIDPSHLNGLSMPAGNQVAEKGEQIMQLMQGQGLYSGTGLSPIQPSKPLIPPQSSNHSQPLQKLYSGSATPLSKPLQHMPSHSDNGSQGQVPSISSGHAQSDTHQAVPAAIMASNHQHLQPHQKQVGQPQSTVQRVLQQNRHMNSDLPTKSQTDTGHADQKPLNNVSQMGTSTTTGMPQSCNDSANVVPSVPSAVAPPWKPSEPPSSMPNPVSQVGSIGSPPIANPAGIESVSSVSQGFGQRQLSGGFPQHGHSAAAQRQQKPQLPHSAPSPPSNQLFQQQEKQVKEEQQSPQQQSQMQAQHLQSVQGSLYVRSTASNLE